MFATTKKKKNGFLGIERKKNEMFYLLLFFSLSWNKKYKKSVLTLSTTCSEFEIDFGFKTYVMLFNGTK